MPASTSRTRRSARAATGYLAATTLAVCGGGLLAGLDSPFVPAAFRPLAGILLVALSARTAGRAWWRGRAPGRP